VETLRFGVLSTARIGVTRVIPALQRSQRCEVVAIASRDEDRANTAAQQLGIATSHSSYEALLADPDVDAVYNPLPNHLHAPWTLAAAEAGKHVLCEKPLAMDAAEAQHMVEGCREAGVVLVEAFMYRMHPQWVRVRELIADGTLGELRAVHSVFSYHNTDPDDIRNIADYGGGGLMDIGCYCIDVSRMLLGGEPVAARGEVQIDPTFGTDVLATGLLRFDGDRHAAFTCATQAAPEQSVHVIGSAGTLTVEWPFVPPHDAPVRLHLRTDGPGDPGETIEIPAGDQYALQGDAFAATVLDGADPSVPWDNGPNNLKVIEAIRAG
jgi:predicted dehydrogenase